MQSTTFQTLLPRQFLPGVLLGLVIGAAFAWQQPLLAFAASVGVAFITITTKSPLIGLLFATFFLPFERIGAYESVVGTIRLSQVFALITIAVWGARKMWTGEWKVEPNPLVIPLMIFLAVSVFGLTHAPNLTYSLGVLLLTAFTIFFSWMIPQLVTSKEKLLRVVWVLLLSATLVGVFGVFQFVGDTIGLPTSVTGLRELYTKDVFGFPRIQSTALEPLYFANFLLLPIGLLYAFFLNKRSPLRQWLSFLLLGLLGVNLVLTVSRGGYVALAVVLFVITLASLRHFLKLRTLIPLALSFVVVLLLVTQLLGAGDIQGINIETFTTHVQNVFFGASYAERIETIEQAQAAFGSSPWVGIGPGSFGPWVATHPLVEPDGGWRIVNNETVEVLAETGLLGFLAIVSVVLILIFRSMKTLIRPGDITVKLILLGAFAAFLGALAQYQTFSILYIMHIWFLVGLLVATQNILLRKQAHD